MEETKSSTTSCETHKNTNFSPEVRTHDLSHLHPAGGHVLIGMHHRHRGPSFLAFEHHVVPAEQTQLSHLRSVDHHHGMVLGQIVVDQKGVGGGLLGEDGGGQVHLGLFQGGSGGGGCLVVVWWEFCGRVQCQQNEECVGTTVCASLSKDLR